MLSRKWAPESLFTIWNAVCWKENDESTILFDRKFDSTIIMLVSQSIGSQV